MAQDEKVPAFDAALGLPMRAGEPATVSKRALEEVNREVVEENKEAMRYHQEAAQVASLMAKRAIRPDEIAALRRRMFDTVSRNMAVVDQVLAGQVKWSPTQTRLFALLTERVMPKLSSITVEDPTSKKLEDLSIEELEAIALGKKKASAVDAVIKQAEVYDEMADKVERREARKGVLEELAYIDGLSQAEREYVARKVAAKAEPEEDQGGKRKPQPSPTDEALANLRKSHEGGLHGIWRRKGYTEEQIEVMERERQAKIAATKAQLKAEKARRLAATMGLDEDAREVAKSIARHRRKTLKEFKVHGLKGVRKPTALAKEAMQRAEREQRRAQRDEGIRIFNTRSIPGVPDEELKTLTLDRLRELRPDLFEQANPGVIEPVKGRS